MDYKEWIMERASDLAQERYGKLYYDLPEHQQEELFNEAEKDYVDYYAAQIDAAYDARQERQLMEGDKDETHSI